jgi:hypothetical protein
MSLSGYKPIQDANAGALPLDAEHDLAAVPSRIETRQVNHDYTIQLEGQFYQIERGSICAGNRESQSCPIQDEPEKSDREIGGMAIGMANWERLD